MAPPQRLDDEAGPNAQQTQEARVAGEALLRLGQHAEAHGGMVPDGVVPVALRAFLIGVGVRSDTVGEPDTGA